MEQQDSEVKAIKVKEIRRQKVYVPKSMTTNQVMEKYGLTPGAAYTARKNSIKINQEAYKMKGPLTKPTVKLVGEDGNAFSIMGRVKKALMRAGADKEYADKYLKEATVADYSYLLTVSMEYVNVE